jgi:hypothetical protein
MCWYCFAIEASDQPIASRLPEAGRRAGAASSRPCRADGDAGHAVRTIGGLQIAPLRVNKRSRPGGIVARFRRGRDNGSPAPSGRAIFPADLDGTTSSLNDSEQESDSRRVNVSPPL